MQRVDCSRKGKGLSVVDYGALRSIKGSAESHPQTHLEAVHECLPCLRDPLELLRRVTKRATSIVLFPSRLLLM